MADEMENLSINIFPAAESNTVTGVMELKFLGKL